MNLEMGEWRRKFDEDFFISDCDEDRPVDRKKPLPMQHGKGILTPS
ncbi:hypothetical protein ABE096_14295 [Robertmurraya massiliosenegalensis]